jgi:hypothetical protein
MIATQQGEPMQALLRCIPALFIPFAKNFRDVVMTVENELGISLVGSER